MKRRIKQDGYFIGKLLSPFTGRKRKYNDESKESWFNLFDVSSFDMFFEAIFEHKHAPYIMIGAIISFICTIYVIVGFFVSIFLTNNNILTPAPVSYDDKLLIEVEEVMNKVIELRQKGNMKEYEDFLSPTMKMYCLDHLGSRHLNRAALESFHMNLAKTITFVAFGNTFTEHTSLAVTYLGEVVDPATSGHISMTCPLLSVLHKIGSSENLAPMSESTNDKSINEDFEKQYTRKNIAEFMHIIKHLLATSGECVRISKELKGETLKSFIMNFFQMADAIGRNVLKQIEADPSKEFEILNYRVDPSSPDYKMYVIGLDGGIYQTDKYGEEDIDTYIHCLAIEMMLNDKFLIKDNLDYTNIKIAMDDVFGQMNQ